MSSFEVTSQEQVTSWRPSFLTMKYEFLLVIGTTRLPLGMLFSPVVGCVVSTSCRPALSPAVGPLFPAVVALVTSCRSPLFTRSGSALLASCLLDHPFMGLLTTRKYSSVLLWAA